MDFEGAVCQQVPHNPTEEAALEEENFWHLCAKQPLQSWGELFHPSVPAEPRGSGQGFCTASLQQENNHVLQFGGERKTRKPKIYSPINRHLRSSGGKLQKMVTLPESMDGKKGEFSPC